VFCFSGRISLPLRRGYSLPFVVMLVRFALVGFGYLSLSRNPAHRPPVARHFKWMGPMLLMIALILAIAS
jgi:hypothetical protein